MKPQSFVKVIEKHVPMMAGFKLMYSQYITSILRLLRHSTEGRQNAQCSQCSETRQSCKYGCYFIMSSNQFKRNSTNEKK